MPATFATSVDFTKPLRTKSGVLCRYVGKADVPHYPHIVEVWSESNSRAIVRCNDHGYVPEYMSEQFEIRNVKPATHVQKLWLTLYRDLNGNVDWIATTHRVRRPDMLALKCVSLTEGEFEDGCEEKEVRRGSTWG